MPGRIAPAEAPSFERPVPTARSGGIDSGNGGASPAARVLRPLWPVDPPAYDGPGCAVCGTEPGTLLCRLDGEDVDLCGDCAAEAFCSICGSPRSECAGCPEER